MPILSEERGQRLTGYPEKVECLLNQVLILHGVSGHAKKGLQIPQQNMAFT